MTDRLTEIRTAAEGGADIAAKDVLWLFDVLHNAGQLEAGTIIADRLSRACEVWGLDPDRAHAVLFDGADAEIDWPSAAQSARRAGREEERQAVIRWLSSQGRSSSTPVHDFAVTVCRLLAEQKHLEGAEPHRQEEDMQAQEWWFTVNGNQYRLWGITPEDALRTAHEQHGETFARMLSGAHEIKDRDGRAYTYSYAMDIAVGGPDDHTAGLSDVAAKALLYDEARRLLEAHRHELMEHAALANLLPADGGRAVAYKAAAGHVVALELVLDDPATLARLREEHGTPTDGHGTAAVGTVASRTGPPVSPNGLDERYRELRAAVAMLARTWGMDPKPPRKRLDAILARFPEVE